MDHDFDIDILVKVWNMSGKSLSIFDYTKEDNMDTFILKELVGSLKDCTLDKQLSLACTWSRVDIAEHVLSEQLDATKGAKFCSALTRTLFHALVWDHTDFCGVLIENGADIYDIQVIHVATVLSYCAENISKFKLKIHYYKIMNFMSTVFFV